MADKPAIQGARDHKFEKVTDLENTTANRTALELNATGAVQELLVIHIEKFAKIDKAREESSPK